MLPKDPEFERLLQAKATLSEKFLSTGIQNGVVRMERAPLAAAAARAGLHVHAVGIGPKIVGGVMTSTTAIRVYVIQKVNQEDGLRDDDAIPSSINGIPTDVIESPPAFLFQEELPAIDLLDLAHRPHTAIDCTGRRKKAQEIIIGGISASREGGSSGTIACLCRSKRQGQEGFILVLSNSHVFGPVGGGNHHLLQPASRDANPPFRRFAEFLRGSEINLNGATANEIDAAVGKLIDGIDHRQEVCSIGSITGKTLATAHMRVRKHGRNTGLRLGIVDDIHCDIACGLSPNGVPITTLFTGQFRVSKDITEPYFAYNGDSGSLVVEEDSPKAVGLLFAAPQDGSYGVANYIDDVLNNLDITLI